MLLWCVVFVQSCFGCSAIEVFFFKQKTAYEMRISDWSSDVCSSDLLERREKQAKTQAKTQAAKELSAMLTAPEDLQKVEQIRCVTPFDANGRRRIRGDRKSVV